MPREDQEWLKGDLLQAYQAMGSRYLEDMVRSHSHRRFHKGKRKSVDFLLADSSSSSSSSSSSPSSSSPIYF